MNNNWIHNVVTQYKKHLLGCIALSVVALFALVAVYAPLLASSQPLIVIWDGTLYFPWFRYLFYSGYYSKNIDLFFNLFIFSLPLLLLCHRLRTLITIFILHLLAFGYLLLFPLQDPASSPALALEKHQTLQERYAKGSSPEKARPTSPDFLFDLQYMPPYAQLQLLLHEERIVQQDAMLQLYTEEVLPTLYLMKKKNIDRLKEQSQQRIEEVKEQAEKAQQQLPQLLAAYQSDPEQALPLERAQYTIYTYEEAKAKLAYIEQKEEWIEAQTAQLTILLKPLFRYLHWEDDAGGDEEINQAVPWWELARNNHKDLVAALLFGTRTSLAVGILAVCIQLLIAIPVGTTAGYYGGKVDIVVSRILEVWEGIPTFFVLLLVIPILQSKSIFLVITILGIFGWTGFCRFIRAEVFKQRNLAYVEACHNMGFSPTYIIFHHILPNALPPVITLLPFGVMGAITSEAGLSFLGLGEENSCSWGVLMDEGRAAFPGESYLLWPPAIILTILLIAIALVGDALRDSIDPKLRKR